MNGKAVTAFAKDGKITTLKKMEIDRITRVELIKDNVFEGSTIKELVKIQGDLPSYLEKMTEDNWQKIIEMVKNGETGKVGKAIITASGIENTKGDVLVSKNILFAINERLNIAKNVNWGNITDRGQLYEKIKSITGAKSISLENMSVEMLQVIGDRLEYLTEKFPQIENWIEDIRETTEPVYAGVFGVTKEQPKHELVFGKTYFTIESAIRRYSSNAASNYHPFNTNYKAVIDHEIGHIIDLLLSKKKYNVNDIYVRGSYGFNLREEVMKEFDIKKLADLKNEVSEYAVEKYGYWREFFAEALSEYLNAPMNNAEPRRAAKWIGERVMRDLQLL